MATELARMQQLFGTTADWAANDIVLGSGELGLELDTDGRVSGKVGDGVKTYSNLDYCMGIKAHVDLVTDQTVSGVKTFKDTILIENQDNAVWAGQLYSNNFFPISGQHATVLDSREIESNLILQARNNAGEAQTLQCGLDGALYWNFTRIADSTGLSGVTYGGFDAAAVTTHGSGFSVSTPATGEYDITFDEQSADFASQSLVATANGLLAAGIVVNVQMVTETTSKIWVFDTVLATAVNAPVTFIRNYIPPQISFS